MLFVLVNFYSICICKTPGPGGDQGERMPIVHSTDSQEERQRCKTSGKNHTRSRERQREQEKKEILTEDLTSFELLDGKNRE